MRKYSLVFLWVIVHPSVYGGNVNSRLKKSRFPRASEVSLETWTDFTDNLPQLPDDIWLFIAENFEKTGNLRALASLAQASPKISALLGERSCGMPAETRTRTLSFLKKYAVNWKHCGLKQNDLIREAIAAAKDGNREPEHLPHLTAAWMASVGKTLQKKAQKIKSPNDRALHWAAVLYTFANLLGKSLALCIDAAKSGICSTAHLGSAVESALSRSVIAAASEAAWHVAEDAVLSYSLTTWEAWNLFPGDPNSRHRSLPRLTWSGAWNHTWIRTLAAATVAASKAAADSESAEVIGAVAYRSAETALILTLISRENELYENLYEEVFSKLKAEDTEEMYRWNSSGLLSEGYLFREQDFNDWKNLSSSRFQGDTSKYRFVRDLFDELETIAKPLWEKKTIPEYASVERSAEWTKSSKLITQTDINLRDDL